MIRHCQKCSSKPHTQDALHGVGLRAINISKTKSGGRRERCTVCGTATEIAAKVEPKKEAA